MAELLIVSDDFKTASELLDWLMDSDDNIDGNNKIEVVEINYDGQISNVKKVNPQNPKYQHFDLLSTLCDDSNKNAEIQRLKARIKELEQLPIYNPRVNKKLKKKVLKLRNQGKTYQAIADELHDLGLKNSYGRRINAKLVERLYDKAVKEKSTPVPVSSGRYTTRYSQEKE